MLIKNKIRGVLSTVKNNFLLSFCLSASFSSFIVYILNFHIYQIKVITFLYTGFIFCFVTFFLWFKSLNKESEIRDSISEFFSGAFTLVIFLITLINLNILNKDYLVSNINIILIIVAVCTGFICLYENSEAAKHESDNKNFKSEKNFLKSFSNKFPKLSEAPITKKIIKIIYTESWPYTLGLFSLVALGATLYIYKIGNYGFQLDEYYHAQVVKTFLEQGKLFSLGDESYIRAPIVSLIALGSHFIFSWLNINQNEMFIYRLPFAVLSVFTIFSIHGISRLYFSKINSLLVSLIFVTEIWFIYFARYFRFYSISLLIISLIIYLNLKFNNLKVILLSFVAIGFSYFYLTDFFLLAAVFVFFRLLQYLYSKKQYGFIALSFLFGLIFLIQEYYKRVYFTKFQYNSTVFSFNVDNIAAQLHWFYVNYYLFLILFSIGTLGIFFMNKKILLLNSFALLNFLFFIFYVNNVQFNFTFRPYYFFLPFIFICAIYTLKIIYYKKLSLFYLIIFLQIFLNIFSVFKYYTDSPGDRYHPTKLIYEKIGIIEGSYDLFKFLNEQIRTKDRGNYRVVFFGGGSLYTYSDLAFDKIYGAATKNKEEITLNNLKEYTESNSNRDIYFIFPANSYVNIKNDLYEKIWGKSYITELTPSFYEFISTNSEINNLYISKDNLSKIFLRSHSE